MKNIKKYIVGFILGIMFVGTLTYAADNGSIGALFEKVGSNWVLNGTHIEDSTIGETKLNVSLRNKMNQINTNKADITSINDKINVGSKWTIAPNGDNLEFKFNGVTKIILGSDGSITAKQYNLN